MRREDIPLHHCISKAMELAQAMEAAELYTKSFKPQEPSIHHIYSNRQSPNPGEGHNDRQIGNSKKRCPCFQCGRSNYDEANCNFKAATCHCCGKVGHIAPVCKSTTTQFISQSESDDRAPSAHANHITLLEDAEDLAMGKIQLGQ